MNIDQAHDFMNAAFEISSDDDDMHSENLNGGGGEADLTVRVCRAIFADIWLAFFQEGQQQSCGQVGLFTGDGKEEILGAEAMFEVRILPPGSLR